MAELVLESDTKAADPQADPAAAQHGLVAALIAGDLPRIAKELVDLVVRYNMSIAEPLKAAARDLGADGESRLLDAVRSAAQADAGPEAWFGVALAASAFKKPKEVLEAARMVIAKEPRHMTALLLVAAASNALGDGEAARAAIDAMLRNDPRVANDAPLLLQSIHADIQRGKPTAALATLDRVQSGLVAAGNEADAWTLRGRALVDAGEPDKAIPAFDRAIALVRDADRQMPLQTARVNAALSAGKWHEAAQGFDAMVAALADRGPQAEAKRTELRLQKAQALAPHDVHLVLHDLEVLDSIPSEGWPASIDLRVTGLLAAGRAEEALAWLEAWLERAPAALRHHAAAAQLRSFALMKLGRTKEAFASAKRVLDLSGPAPGDARSAAAAMNAAVLLQRWDEAVKYHDCILKRIPAAADNDDLRVVLGLARLRLGDAAAAFALTERAKPQTQDTKLIRDFVYAEALLMLGRHEEALHAADGALAAYGKRMPPENSSALHVLRAVAFNQLKRLDDSISAATAAIETEGGGVVEVIRLAARMHRALAKHQLGRTDHALEDVDASLQRFASAAAADGFALIGPAETREEFECSLWFAKGVLLQADLRNEEAMAALSRAERLEHKYIGAGVRRGYAVLATGAPEKALEVFESTLPKAKDAPDRAEVLVGRGIALARLKRFEESIASLQQALDLRLTTPDADPKPFEFLGIAYDALHRNGAALRAFKRAWKLMPEKDRTANLARGIVAAELRLEDPAAALEFLDRLPEALKNDRTLLFNRALALDGLGRRREAIDCLVRAKEMGLDKAKQELDRLDAPAGLARWTDYWFGAQARGFRPQIGWTLVALASVGVAAPLFQWIAQGKLDWYLLLVPSFVALLLLALPNLKSVSVEAGKVKLSAEPLSATGREAAAVALPVGFSVPSLNPIPSSSAASPPAGP